MSDFAAYENTMKLIAPIMTAAISSSIGLVLKSHFDNTWADPMRRLTTQSKSAAIKADLLHSFEEYIGRGYAKNWYLNTVVAPVSSIPLFDLYTPVTLRPVAGNPSYCISKKLDDYDARFISGMKFVMITDTAGMGKSTILKYLFLSCIQKILDARRIPVLIELRRLDRKTTILDLIVTELNGLSQPFSRDLVSELLLNGGFTFLFDGYDEIAYSERSHVTKDLMDFISKARSNNDFVIASRPEESLQAFTGFNSFHVQGLKREEAKGLITKYGNALSTPDVAEKLLSRLDEERRFDAISTLLENPLLVSLLYRSFAYTPNIPLKASDFFNQVFESLFYRHDLSKDAYQREKLCDLDRDDFHKVCRSLGIITLKHGLGYSKSKILEHIDKAKVQSSRTSFSSSRFLDDISGGVPLLLKEGVDDYRWSHRSLQDYFAASFIYSDAPAKRGDYLRNLHTARGKYSADNVLDIYYDLDNLTFRNVLILDILKRWMLHFEQASDDKYENISPESVKVRTSLLSVADVIIRPIQGNRKDFDVIVVANDYMYLVNNLLIKGDTTIKATMAESDGSPSKTAQYRYEHRTKIDGLNPITLLGETTKTNNKKSVRLSDGDIELDFNKPAYYDTFNDITRTALQKSGIYQLIPDYNRCKNMYEMIRKENEARVIEADSFLDFTD